MKTQVTPNGETIKTKEAEAHRAEIRRASMQRRQAWQIRVKSAKIGGMPKVFLGLPLWK